VSWPNFWGRVVISSNGGGRNLAFHRGIEVGGCFGENPAFFVGLILKHPEKNGWGKEKKQDLQKKRDLSELPL